MRIFIAITLLLSCSTLLAQHQEDTSKKRAFLRAIPNAKQINGFKKNTLPAAKSGALALDSIKDHYEIGSPDEELYLEYFTYQDNKLKTYRYVTDWDASIEYTYTYNALDSLVLIERYRTVDGVLDSYSRDTSVFDMLNRKIYTREFRLSGSSLQDTSTLNIRHFNYQGNEMKIDYIIDSIYQSFSKSYMVQREDYSYSQNGELTGLTTTDIANGDTIRVQLFEYDEDGNLVYNFYSYETAQSFDSLFFEDGKLVEYSSYYQYNATSDLEYEWRETFQYDLNGNLELIYFWEYDYDEEEWFIDGRARVVSHKGKVSDYNQVLAEEWYLANFELLGTLYEQLDIEYFDGDWELRDRLNYYFSAPNSIGELEFSEISIYPNPTEDIIIFKKNQGAVAFQIYDQSGRLVMKGKNLDGSLNIEKLAPGTYTLLVQQASLSYSAQIQKQ